MKLGEAFVVCDLFGREFCRMYFYISVPTKHCEQICASCVRFLNWVFALQNKNRFHKILKPGCKIK